MPNDYEDLVERAMRSQVEANKNVRLRGRVEVGLGFLGNIAKSIVMLPFRFPDSDRLREKIEMNKRATDYWYSQKDLNNPIKQNPLWQPPGSRYGEK